MPASGVHQSEARIATTAEGRVAWVEAGPSGVPARSALPLVLIHGFTGHRDDFIGVLDDLGRHRRVIAPDLRGHGDSAAHPGESGWSFEQLVRDLLAFLDHLGLERIDLLGHSMGGFVALRFALAHSERVRSLIFLCSAPETPSALPKQGFEKAADIADARGIDGLQAIFEKVGEVDASESINRWGERYWLHHRRRFGSMTPESYRGLGTAFFESESLVSRLREIAVPTLVLVGEFDEEFLPGADLFEQTLPDARRFTLTAAEHHPHQENTQDFLSEVETHLATVAAADDTAGAGRAENGNDAGA